MTWLIVLLAILVVGNISALYLLWQRGKVSTDVQGMVLLQNQLQDLTRAMDQKLGEGNRTMSEFMSTQSEQARVLISTINKQVSDQLLEVVKGVSETKESTRQVFTIAEQLKNLEKILTHQKQRGNWGEASLKLILENFLPPTAFKTQYQFPGGETVDAVILTKDGMIPIDAKFSLDNYTRLANAVDENQRTELEKTFKNDLKARIDETAKYIRPKDGTLPLAFMYIPAEAIYYDLLVGEVNEGKVNARNLIDYAYRDKKVIIASPTTFMAYLLSVANGLQAFKVEENSKEIIKNVENLSRHIKAYEDYYKKIGNALSTTVNHYNVGYKELGKIDKDVLRVTGGAIEIDVEQLDKPALEGRE